MVVASVLSALSFETGSRIGTILPIVAVLGVGMLTLAVSRFDVFVAAILLIRASLDAAKISASSVDATGAISLLFIVTGIAWLAVQRKRPTVESSPFVPSPFVPPLTALVVAGTCSIAFSKLPMAAAIEVVRLATVLVIVAVLNRLLVDRQRIKLILSAVFASSIVPVLVALFQIATGRVSYFPGGFSRVQATFEHPNPFAAYLTMLIILGAALYRHLPGGYRLLMLALLCCYAGLLVATYARGEWIAAVAGLLVVGFLDNRRLFMAVLVGAVVLVLTIPSIQARFADLSQAERPSGAPGNSLAWRVEYWRQILNLQTDPLFGIGLRSVELSAEAAKAPHNDFIRVYVETGLVGLLAYLWLIFVLLRQSVRAVARAPDGLASALAAAFAAAVTSFLLLSLIGNLISQLVILWYFVAIASAGVAVSRHALDHPLEQDAVST